MLLGKLTVIGLSLITAGAGFASIDVDPLLVSTLFDAIAFLVGVFGVLQISYLVFMTQGKGHYELTLWRIADVFLANILAQTAANLAVWKFGFSTAVPTLMFTHTPPSIGVWYALYDLFIYSSLLFTGSGITDNQAVHELPRILVALQSLWNSFSYLIIFSASVATLTTHTDERPAAL